MTTRTSARHLASSSSTPAPAPSRTLPPVARPTQTASPQLLELRRQWKWAALSQFYYTFAPLIALEDVTLVDIENDLVDSTMTVIPRVMQRLLTTLSNDRKITTDNWQSALRRQYLRRDPAANPIGVEHIAPKQSRATTIASEGDEEGQESRPDGSTKANGYLQAVKTEERDERMASLEESKEGNISLEEDDEERTGEEPMDIGLRPVEDKHVVNDVKEETKDWADLAMLEKLDSIHTVTEWHFQNPLRLRQIMRSDDENASWRTEPVGFDAKCNAYWFIGAERLWIQREPPKRPTKTKSTKSTKRKAKHSASPRKAKAPRLSKEVSSAQADQASHSNRSTPSVGISRNNGRSKAAKSLHTSRSPWRSEVVDETPSMPGSSSRARAAKTQANAKLDLQAKQLLAAKAEFESLNRRSSRGSVARPLGTRISRRLHGDDDDDEWQQIPPEWLEGNDEPAPSPSKRPARTGTRTSIRITLKESPRKPSSLIRRERSEEPEYDGFASVNGDGESDLTELSDTESSSRKAETSGTKGKEAPLTENIAQNEGADVTEPWPPADFVEWETICVSLQEWETIALRFEKATYHAEKHLYRRLTQEIVPYVTEILREAEKQRQKEEALMNRKRSSRLAIRESEREAARQAAIKQVEEEEKMARIRRLEARSRREEEEKAKREEERERRRKEREERELARAQRIEMLARGETEDSQRNKAFDKPNVEERTGKIKEKGKPRNKVKDTAAKKDIASANKDINGHDKHPTKTPRRQSRKNSKQKSSGEDWELDCEICGAKGRNKDGGVPLMSCGKCGKWQHISCHDAADDRTGRKRRNWDEVDFFCQRCSGQAVDDSTQNNTYWQYERPYPTLHPSSMASSYLTSSGLMPNTPFSNGYSRLMEPRLAVNGQKTPGNYAYMNYPTRGTTDGQYRSDGASITNQQTVPSSRVPSSVTFTHYQPLQRGFSPHPATLNSQDQRQTHGSSHAAYPIQSSIRDQKDSRNHSGASPHHPYSITSNGAILPPYTTHPSLESTPSSSQGHSQQNAQRSLSHHYSPGATSGTQPYYSSQT